MKYILLITMLFGINVFASEEPQNSIIDAGLGVGFSGTKGLIGFGLDYHLNQHDALSLTVAADLNGGFVGTTYKYFDKKMDKHVTGTFFDKCLFLFDCDTYPYLEAGAQYFSNTNRTITSDTTGTRVFEMDSKLLALAGFGTRHVFKNKMYWDFSISYRTLITGGETRLTSGVEQANDRTLMYIGNNILGVGMTVGYQF
jgi:hypothetical protein